MSNIVSAIAFVVVAVWVLFVGSCTVFTVADSATGQTVTVAHKDGRGTTVMQDHDSKVSERETVAMRFTRTGQFQAVGNLPSFESETVVVYSIGFKNHRDPDLGPAVEYKKTQKKEYWVNGQKARDLEHARDMYAAWCGEKKAPPTDAPPQ